MNKQIIGKRPIIEQKAQSWADIHGAARANGFGNIFQLLIILNFRPAGLFFAHV
jgi:hypothetical protein